MDSLGSNAVVLVMLTHGEALRTICDTVGEANTTTALVLVPDH